MTTLERLGVLAIRDTITSYRDAVRAHAAGLNRLNVYPVPDGDTGTNMARTLDAVVIEMEGVPAELVATCRAIAHGSLMGARGNSGVILSQILRGISLAFEDADEVDPAVVAAALGSATAAAYAAVLRPVEGTILTVIREAAGAASRIAGQGGTLLEVLAAARGRAQQALDHTPDLLPVLKAAGVVDAGGAGFLLLLDAALHVVDGRPLPEPDDDGAEGPSPAAAAGHHGHHGHHEPGGGIADLRYEVMYFLDLPDERIDGFRATWGGVGDSIVVVGGGGLWNCHIHTDDIGGAIEAAIEAGGRPWQIRVTDLFDDGDGVAAAPEAEETTAACAVVAVATGAGVCRLLQQLGVALVVTGGQTMNPSTAELLDAVERVAADQVVLLPNNRNIVPVARQVDALTSKVVRVVPTGSVPEALAALVAFDAGLDGDENARRMSDAIAALVVGEVTRAVRAAPSPAGPVAAGDWIGLVQGEGIVAAGPVLAEVTESLLDQLVTPAHELLTVIEGAEATPEATDAVAAWLQLHRPAVELEVHRGGQPLYPYLFGAE